MLFLDTCVVNAEVPFQSKSNTYSVGYMFNLEGGASYGSITSGSGSINPTKSGVNYHVELPCQFSTYLDGSNFDNNDTIGWAANISSLTATNVFINNVCLKDRNGSIVSSGITTAGTTTNWFVSKYYQLFNLGVGNVSFPLIVSFDVTFDGYPGATTNTRQGTFNFTINSYFVDASSIYGEYDYRVYDSTTEQQLSDLNTTQESIKDTAEDTNSKITDFFGNFFSNLIGVFVPESDYFSTWFTRVNDLLADKLGILYFPFDFIIDTLTTINSNSSSSSGQIIFPEMSFTNNVTSETYILLNRQVINLNDYDVPFTSSENSSLVGTSNFTSLLSIIRLFTGIAFTLALVHLFIDKLHLILRGSERG